MSKIIRKLIEQIPENKKQPDDRRVYSVKFTLFLNFLLAESRAEAIEKGIQFIIDNIPSIFEQFEIEIISEEE